MAKQAIIKDIAKMAGVSPGTVDRIIHNRGNVSAKRRAAVEQALAEVGYKTNIHTSAVSFRKTITIAITHPIAYAGGYWESVERGLNEALHEFSDIDIHCKYFPYEQFDSESCREAYAKVLAAKGIDAVIIGATFKEPTQVLCASLDSRALPYVFVDSTIEGTSPWAVFASDQNVCGRLVGRLLDAEDGRIAIFGTRRTGAERAQNSIERESGLMEYLHASGLSTTPLHFQFNSTNLKVAQQEIEGFFSQNPQIRYVTILNSSGYIIADTLKAMGRSDVRLVGFDYTTSNRRCLEEGTIHSLICQRPVALGYSAIRYLVNHFIYNLGKTAGTTLIPVDVLFKESLSCYAESFRYGQ